MRITAISGHRRRAMPGQAASRSEFQERTGQDYAGGICHQLWDSPRVNWDGKMLGCCRNFWGDFGANAFRDGFVNAVNSERMVHARAMLRGAAEPRDDIPCTTCDIYQGMRRSDSFLRRHNLARGQTVSVSDALSVAADLRAQGQFAEAIGMCRRILAAEPSHAGALRCCCCSRWIARRPDQPARHQLSACANSGYRWQSRLPHLSDADRSACSCAASG